MSTLSFDQAREIIDAALERGKDMNPLTVAVLDAGGGLVAYAKEGGGLLRENIARGKAYGALGMGKSSRELGWMADERPMFMQAVIDASGGRVVPVPGGVLVRDDDDEIIGAVGVSGDISDNDELVAVAGIEAAGLKADTGE